MSAQQVIEIIAIDIDNGVDLSSPDFVGTLAKTLWTYCKEYDGSIKPQWSLATMAEVLKRGLEIVQKEPVLEEIKGPAAILGPFYGQGDSLVSLMSVLGHPKHRNYIFLGGYFGLGFAPVEAFLLLVCLKILHPHNVHLLRGHTEEYSTLKQLNIENWLIYRSPEYANFRVAITEKEKTLERLNSEASSEKVSSKKRKKEMIDKLSRELRSMKKSNSRIDTQAKSIVSAFYKLVSNLPCAAVIDNRILCLQGGPGPNLLQGGLAGLRNCRKLPSVLERKIIRDAMWSCLERAEEPVNCSDHIPRFSEADVSKFCAANNISLIVRGRQLVHNGYLNFPSQMITLSSAIAFMDAFRNAGAAVTVAGTKIEVHRVRMAEPSPKSCDLVRVCGRNTIIH